MKKLLITLGVAAAMMSGSAMAAENSVDWGNGSGFVQSMGADIDASSCTYDFAGSGGFAKALETLNLTPNNPQKQAALNKNKVGDSKTSFSYTFKDCPPKNTKGKTKLAMYVDTSNTQWTPTGHGDGVLGNIAPTQSEKAVNAFIRLYAEGSTDPMKFGVANPIEKALGDSTSDITFNFEAELYSPTGSATSGKVEANAPFVVQYK